MHAQDAALYKRMLYIIPILEVRRNKKSAQEWQFQHEVMPAYVQR